MSERLEQVPPYDAAAEIAVISSMIIDPTVIGPVCMILTRAEDFYRDEHQVLYGVITSLYQRNSAIDALIVNSELRTQNLLADAGGFDYLKQVVEAVPSSAHAEYYAAIVRELAQKRAMLRECSQTIRHVYEGQRTADEIVAGHAARIAGIADARITSEPVKIDQIGDPPNDGRGIDTGMGFVDGFTHGLHKGQLCIVAARPSVGKTAWALTVANSLASGRVPTAFFSMEMSRELIRERLLQIRSGVPAWRAKRSNVEPQDAARWQDAQDELAAAPLWIDDSPGLTIEDLKARVRRLVRRHAVEVVMIDYLGKMRMPAADRHDLAIGKVTSEIVTLAKQQNIAVMLLCQVNRANDKEQRPPRASDLRDSGSIEQDADQIIMLHRPRVSIDAEGDEILGKKGWAIVDKNRNGPTGRVAVEFEGSITKFIDLPGSGSW